MVAERTAKLPNFLVVGAARCGTTSLFYYLLQHPDIYMPSRKECMFFSGMSRAIPGRGRVFANSIVSDVNAYKELFWDCRDEHAVGEISTDYLYFYSKSIPNIQRLLGEKTKIIVLLRHPAHRAYSHYLHHRRYGIEELTFEEALAAEEERKAQNYFWAYYYSDASFYADAVQAYLNAFEDVKVVLYDDLSQDPKAVLKDLYRFVGVDHSFVPDLSERYNVSGEYRSPVLAALSQRSDSIKQILFPVFKRLVEWERGRRGLERILSRLLTKPRLADVTRAMLVEQHRDDVLRTQALIHRDLAAWLR